MLNRIQKDIIIDGLKLRASKGEDIKAIIAGYTNLSEEEKQEILEAVNKPN